VSATGVEDCGVLCDLTDAFAARRAS